jgi:hypothetical protein
MGACYAVEQHASMFLHPLAGDALALGQALPQRDDDDIAGLH